MNSLKLYRSSAAVRLSVNQERGVVFAEGSLAIPGMEKAMPEKGQNKYQWKEGKISIALKPEELMALAAKCEELRLGNGEVKELNMVHDPAKGGFQGDKKALVLRRTNGSTFLTVGEFKDKNNSKKVNVPLSREDLYRLEKFSAQTAMVLEGWATAASAATDDHRPGDSDAPEGGFPL
jgi:hypothetical protein